MKELFNTGDYSGLVLICNIIFALGVLVIFSYYLYKKYELEKQAAIEKQPTEPEYALSEEKHAPYSIEIRTEGKKQEYEIPKQVFRLIKSISNERDTYKEKLVRALNTPFGTPTNLN